MKKHHLFSAAFLLVVACTTAFGQIDCEMTPPAKDFGDLYERAAASRLVIVGTVVKEEGVSPRLTQEAMEKMTSLPLGGPLFTVRVEGQVCRQEDFQAGSPVSADNPQAIYIFLPPESMTNGHCQEGLWGSESKRYLFFLVEPSQEIQKEWTEKYKLDPTRVYYRGEEGDRGIVPLAQPTPDNRTPKQPAVLDKVRQLCAAVRPPKLSDKLAALDKLGHSIDPILQREALIAEKSLRAQPQSQK